MLKGYEALFLPTVTTTPPISEGEEEVPQLIGEVKGTSVKDEMDEMMVYVSPDGRYASGEWRQFSCGCWAFILSWDNPESNGTKCPPLKAPCCGSKMLEITSGKTTALIRRHTLACNMYTRCIEHLY